MKSYKELSDAITEEITEMANSIDIYAESVIRMIDSMEADESFRQMYFTETTEEAEKAEKEKTKENIFKKIKDAVSKIFKKLADMLTKGKIKVKSSIQRRKMKDLLTLVNKYKNHSIIVINLWDYGKFVDGTIASLTERVDEKTLEMIESKRNGKSHIEILTLSLDQISEDIRTNPDKYPRLMPQDIPDTLKPVSNTDNVIINKSTEMIFNLVKSIFSKCPPKLYAIENVTIGELYRRLNKLSPETYPELIVKKAKFIESKITSQATLQNLKLYDDVDPSKDAGVYKSIIKYSSQLSKLMISYVKFYQTMCDYYISELSKAVVYIERNMSV